MHDEKIKEAFLRVKEDILSLHQEIVTLAAAQQKIIDVLEELQKNQERILLSKK